MKLFFVITLLFSSLAAQALDHKLECFYNTDKNNKPVVTIGKKTIIYNTYEERNQGLEVCVSWLRSCTIQEREYHTYDNLKEIILGGSTVYEPKCGHYSPTNPRPFLRKSAKETIANFIQDILVHN